MLRRQRARTAAGGAFTGGSEGSAGIKPHFDGGCGSGGWRSKWAPADGQGGRRMLSALSCRPFVVDDGRICDRVMVWLWDAPHRLATVASTSFGAASADSGPHGDHGVVETFRRQAGSHCGGGQG